MARSWKGRQGRQGAERRSRWPGRGHGAGRGAHADQAYVLGFRLAQLRQEMGLSQTEIAGLRLVADFEDHDVDVSISEVDRTVAGSCS
jgi:hypothetical protein